MTVKNSYKNFLSAYKLLSTNSRKLRSRLKSNTLTRVEKNILKSLLYLVSNKPKKALEVLHKTTPTSSFYKAYKSFALGLVNNHLSDFSKAARYLVSAIVYFEKLSDKTHLFRCISVISGVYFNLQTVERLKKYYQTFKEISDETLQSSKLDYEYRIYISYLENKPFKSLSLIHELSLMYQAELERTYSAYSTLKFMNFVLVKDFDSCYLCLDEYKKRVGLKVVSNYIFMMKLINYYTKNAPIYVYDSEFKDCPYLHYQIKVIQQLSINEIDQASVYWNKLHNLVPELYLENFHYKGVADIFFITLEKALQNLNLPLSNEVNLDDVNAIKKINDKLDYLFSFNKFFTKGELIMYLWGETWSPRLDGRLRTTLSKYKANTKSSLIKKSGKYKKAS